MSGSPSTRVLVIDPHPIVRVGLDAVLRSDPRIEVAGLCDCGLAALELCRAESPHLVITEVHLPGMSGIDVCRTLKQGHPRVEVLILTSDDRDDTVFEAIRAGATGYILKDITPENFLRAVHSLMRGQTMIHPTIARRMLNRLSFISQDAERKIFFGDGLTEREAEILAEVARGATNKEIAKKLFISESTVKSRLRTIFRKIDVRDRTEAASYAAQKGYLRS